MILTLFIMALCPHSPHLLADKLGGAGCVLPRAEEQLAQERVQGLLLVAVLLAAAGVLLLERGQEPLEHKQGALGRVLFGGRGDEERRVFAPVRAELGQARAREDKGRCRKGREVAVEGCDGLQTGALAGRVSKGALETGNAARQRGCAQGGERCRRTLMKVVQLLELAIPAGTDMMDAVRDAPKTRQAGKVLCRVRNTP